MQAHRRGGQSKSTMKAYAPAVGTTQLLLHTLFSWREGLVGSSLTVSRSLETVLTGEEYCIGICGDFETCVGFYHGVYSRPVATQAYY